MTRFLVGTVLLVILHLGWVQGVLIAQKPNVPGVPERQIQGSVVSVDSSKLVMSASDGVEQVHQVDSATTVMIDNKPAQLLDLKKGDKIVVTIGPEAKVLTIVCQRTSNSPTS